MAQYAGLDVSVRENSICVVDGEGAVANRSTVPTDPEAVAQHFAEKGIAPDRIVHESGQLSIWLQRGLVRLGLPAVCIDARLAHRALSAKLNKSDRADAEGLAQLARTGWFTEVHIRSEEADRLRTLIAARERLIRLAHAPGHAQVDFGEAVGEIGGVVRKLHYFAIALPHSDAFFIKTYPAETTEAFCDGHVSAFAFFGGVPLSILYDNTTLAVTRILGDGTRQRTRAFSELQSHYLFEDRFGRPGQGNDKGHVEWVIGFGRRNFLVPMPRFESFEALNASLEEQCRKRQDAVLRGHTETIGERLMRDLDALMALPAVPYDACEKLSTRVSSISMVRYRGNDYSVPVAYAHHEVQVRGYGTAEKMLHRAGVASGTRVLIAGASGGVGSAAVQLAKRRGAEVIAIAGRAKIDQVRAIGADHVIERDADPLAVLGKESVDVVVDNVAGRGFGAMLDVLKRSGNYVSSGAIGGPLVQLDMRTFYLKDLNLIGCTAWDEPVFPNLLSYIERGEIRPLLAKTFPLDQIAAAQREFLEKAHVGKFVLIPPPIGS